MKLPPIPHPHRYVGLYVYDFGARVSVGYTAGEIRVLRESDKHRDGTAYEIYRACESGALELRGVLDWRLTAREAMCFLRADQAAARADYEMLCRASEHDPVPCAVEMQLARLDGFEPPHVTALSYAAAATTPLAAWLAQHAGKVGDQVVCGIDVHATWVNSDGVRIVSCRLPALLDYSDRPAEEVLRSVHDPLQR
jgi:hypothetical protein